MFGMVRMSGNRGGIEHDELLGWNLVMRVKLIGRVRKWLFKKINRDGKLSCICLMVQGACVHIFVKFSLVDWVFLDKSQFGLLNYSPGIFTSSIDLIITTNELIEFVLMDLVLW